ncbi:MAG TPA: hypothetical protein VGD61_23755 [Pyrinomonadaceae bacterium]
MKPLIALSVIPLLLTVFSACRNSDTRLSSSNVSAIAPEYERAIQDLTEGKDPQTVKTAILVLSDAKTQAFPALIKHLSDKTPASVEHFSLRAILCAPESTPCPPWQPTIGEACFEILQSEVEGNWPKAFRSHYILTADNVGEWWESRRTMSLKDLQLDAATTSLERAKRNGDADAIRFLQEHLKDVQSGRCCPEGMGGG